MMAKATFTVALLFGLCAIGHAAECGLDEGIELFPCSNTNVTQPTTECCAGIKAFNDANCFCLQSMIDYDPTFFVKVQDYAKIGCTDITIKPPGDEACPGDLINGFEQYNSLQEVKDAVEKRKPKAPPSPPARTFDEGQKGLKVDIVLGDKNTAWFEDNKADFITELAEQLGVEEAQIVIGLVSSGSAIVPVTILPAGGAAAEELPPEELERLSAKIDDPAGLALPEKFGQVKATVAPMPEGNDASGLEDVGEIPLNVQKTEKQIGDSILGIPRIDFFEGGSEYQGGFEISSSYAASLSMQGAPGFSMAIILLVVMFLMLLVLVISKICGTCSDKCKQAYMPRPYTKKQLLITKGVMVAFAGLTAVGCFIIYADGPALLNGVKDLTDEMANTATNLIGRDGTVPRIAGALVEAGGVLTDPTAGSSGGKTPLQENQDMATELEDQGIKVDDAVRKAKKDIDDAMDTGAQMTLFVASGILGITIIIAVFGFLGFWRVLIFFIVILSILMIVSWIVMGVVAITTVFADDLCTAMSDYVTNPNDSDLSSVIPCMDGKTSVKTMNTVRKNVRSIIKMVNEQLQEYAGANPYLKYLCYQYVELKLEDMCKKKIGADGTEVVETPFYKDPYADFVCQAYHAGDLGDITSVYPQAKCPFPTQFFSVEVGNFGTDLVNLRCPFKTVLDKDECEPADGASPSMTEFKDGCRNDFGLAQCYTQRQIPYDIFDDAAKKGAAGQKLLDVVPDVEGLIQCSFVTDAFKAMDGPCNDMVKALLNLYYGFVIISVCYFCLWVTMIVIITRLQHKDKMQDAEGSGIPKV